MKIVLGISGASGSILGLRALEVLLLGGHEVHLIVSEDAAAIARAEVGIDLGAGDDANRVRTGIEKHYASPRLPLERLFVHAARDFWSPPASGSFQTDGMILAPCSMKTLGWISAGGAGTLIERAADVTLKEGRRLVLCPRETPLSAIHLENMLKLARLGVRIVPPAMGFYHRPASLEEMTDFCVGRLLDAAGVEHELYLRWGEDHQQ